MLFRKRICSVRTNVYRRSLDWDLVFSIIAVLIILGLTL